MEKYIRQMGLRSWSLEARTRFGCWIIMEKWELDPQKCMRSLNREKREGHMWAIFMVWEEQAMQIKMMFNQMPKGEVAKTDQVPERMEKCH